MALDTSGPGEQSSFCVALHEALFGYRPFAGHTVEEISKHVFRGERLAPPARTLVPQWLQGVVARGVAADPEQRFPTMDALLGELTRDRGHNHRRLAWAAGVGAVVAALAAVQLPSTPACSGAAGHLVGVWDPARQEAVERAIQATDLDFAADTASRVRADLDTYASAWTAMHTGACQAHQRGEQSSAALDLRMQCLQRRLGELAAVVEVLAEADAQTVTNAVQAVRGLQPVATCSDPGALLEEQRRLGHPRDPQGAAQVEALRRKIARVAALSRAGQVARSLALSAEVLAEAQTVDFLPTLAEAQYWRGRLLQESSLMPEAAAMLRRAYLTAVRAGSEELQARALLVDVFVQGYGLRAFTAADRAHEVAAALIDRIAPGTPLQAELLNNLAAARHAQQRHAEAEALYHETLALRRRILPVDHMDIGVTLSNLALTMIAQHRVAEAEQSAREAVLVFRRGVGAGHPLTSVTEANLALILFDAAQPDEARVLVDRALPVLGAAFGRELPDLADFFAISGLLHLADQPARALDDLRHGHALGERPGAEDRRSRTRFALAQGLWARVPDQRARALELARQAATDAAATGDAVRRAEILAWLRDRGAP